MLNDLKQYITKDEDSFDEYGYFILLVLERTKNIRLLNYFIDTSRQNVWECKNRNVEIIRGYTYDYSLYEDIFHDLSDKYTSEGTDYGCVSIVLLMILFCYLEETDIKVYLVCDSTDYYCEDLDSQSKNGNGDFTSLIKYWVKELRRYFEIREDENFIHLFRTVDDVTGEVDDTDSTCESFGSFLAFKLMNKKKRKEFQEIMSVLDFVKFDKDTFYVADVDNYNGYYDAPVFEMKNVADYLKNKEKVRSADAFQDVLVSYSDDLEVPNMCDFMNSLMKTHISSREIIL